jgi:hypothetical protein
MKRHIYIPVVALLLSMLPACFYSDSEMYKVNPVPGDPPIVSITTSLDTLTSSPPVNDSLEVIYEVEIEGGEFYYMYAVIANNLAYESESIYGSFWVKPSMADKPGVDTLYLDFYYSSNTNSLADIVKYESLMQTLAFALDFNRADIR